MTAVLQSDVEYALVVTCVTLHETTLFCSLCADGNVGDPSTSWARSRVSLAYEELLHINRSNMSIIHVPREFIYFLDLLQLFRSIRKIPFWNRLELSFPFAVRKDYSRSPLSIPVSTQLQFSQTIFSHSARQVLDCFSCFSAALLRSSSNSSVVHQIFVVVCPHIRDWSEFWGDCLLYTRINMESRKIHQGSALLAEFVSRWWTALDNSDSMLRHWALWRGTVCRIFQEQAIWG